MTVFDKTAVHNCTVSKCFFSAGLQICEMNNCQKCVFFEAKKKMDLFMWYVACVIFEALWYNSAH